MEKVTCLNETSVEEQPNIPIGKLEDTELDGSVPQTIPADEKTVSTSVKFEVPHEQSPGIGCVVFSTNSAVPIPYLFLLFN